MKIILNDYIRKTYSIFHEYTIDTTLFDNLIDKCEQTKNGMCVICMNELTRNYFGHLVTSHGKYCDESKSSVRYKDGNLIYRNKDFYMGKEIVINNELNFKEIEIL